VHASIVKVLGAMAAVQPKLATHLLELFARGFLSGTEVQTIAKAAWDDGWAHDSELAHRLAHAGNSGTNKGYVVAALLNAASAAGLLSHTAAPYVMQLPNGKGTLEIFLPHELYKIMEMKHGLATMCLSQEEYNSQTGLGPLLREWGNHDDVQIRENLHEVAVLGFHSDAVVYTSTVRAGGMKSVVVGNMNAVSAQTDATRSIRETLFCISKERLCKCGNCGGFCTFQAITDVLAWSFRCLKDGVSPSRRHDDTPWTRDDLRNRLASGTVLKKGALLQVRGDWGNLNEMFRIRSTSSEQFCWMLVAKKHTHTHQSRHDRDTPQARP
jgi:hypothetical protein